MDGAATIIMLLVFLLLLRWLLGKKHKSLLAPFPIVWSSIKWIYNALRWRKRLPLRDGMVIKQTDTIIAIQAVLKGVRKAKTAEREGKGTDLVYIIENDWGEIKVGRTTNLPSRFAAFKTANSRHINIVGVLAAQPEVEKKLQDILEPFQTETENEWFEKCKEIEYIIDHANR